MPTLILQGLKDEIARPSVTKQLFDRISSVQKRLVHYNNGYHELFSDSEGEKYKRDILAFLGEVLEKDPPPLGIEWLTQGTLKKNLESQVTPKRGTAKKYIYMTIIALLYFKGLYL
jgi:hypothetical protein